jgi:large subunit ribosomal protein L7/L12
LQDAHFFSFRFHPSLAQLESTNHYIQMYCLLTIVCQPLNQTRLNIPDLPVGGFAAAPPPGQAAAAAAEEEEAAPAAQEKTLFNLKLESFEAGSKPKIIKEVKSMLGLSLVDSKKFVESAPKVLKESVPKEEAEKIVETLKGLGAKAIME